MPRRYDTVSLLSDYGVSDETAGVVRAVIADLAAHVRIVDVTHGIARFDVRAASLSLARAIAYLPSGVVVACVDPDGGFRHRAIAIEVGDDASGVLIGADNGVLAPAVALAGGARRAVVLDNPEFHLGAPGSTQRGRDVFAPIAAHLCNGVDLSELGSTVDADELMPGVVPLPRVEGDTLAAEVLWIDHFGNVQLNVGYDDVAALAPQCLVRVGEIERVVTMASTFAEIGAGAVGMLTDGAGLMMLSLDRRSAADELHVAGGDQVTLLPLGDGQGASAGAMTTTVELRGR